MENGVYIGKNGRLFEEIAVPDQGQMSGNLTAIKSFADRYPDIPVSMILVPDAALCAERKSSDFCRKWRSESADQYGQERTGRFGKLD